MKKLLLALALLLIPAAAGAQCTGVFPAGTVCGNSTGSSATPKASAFTGFPIRVGTTPVTNGTTLGLLYNNVGILGNLTTSVNGLLGTNGAGVPAITTTFPSGVTIPLPIRVSGATVGGIPYFSASTQMSFTGALPLYGIVYGGGASAAPAATASAASSVLVTSAGSIPSLSTTLPNGILATTQAALDNSTKVATTAYVDSAITALAACGAPYWLPCPQGVLPYFYADFINGHYWYNNASYATLADWLTATAGTFTRAVTGYYTNITGYLASAAINTARLDYDPQTNRPLGLILEPTFDNSILRSENFQNATWTKTNVVATDNSFKAPNNTTTAAIITENGGSWVGHELYQSVALAGSGVLSSIYGKAGTGSYLNMAVDDGTVNSYIQAICDLSQGGFTESSVKSSAGTNSISQLIVEPAPDFGDGWYRCTMQGLLINATGTANFHFGLATGAHFNTYNSSGQALTTGTGKNLYVWGAQSSSSPQLPFTYVATTNAALSGGGDILKIGVDWDVAANSMSYVQEYDVRGTGTWGGSIVMANAYVGTTDVWSINGPNPIGTHYPSANVTTTSLTAPIPGVSIVAIRDDPTSLTMAVNGSPVATTTVSTTRVKATAIRFAGRQTSTSNTDPMRLRKVAGYNIGLADSTLVTQSRTNGLPIPALASTINATDTNWIGFPKLAILPSGYLLSVYGRYNTVTQGAMPSTLQYQTAPTSAGPWSTKATAISNSSSNVDIANSALITLPSGTILLPYSSQDNTSGTFTGTLKLATGTETSAGVVSWSAGTVITGSPFFTGTGATTLGDTTVSTPILMPDGRYMLMLYGPAAVASANTSLGAIFSTTPTDPTSWGNFTILANGNNYTLAQSFSEANGYVDPAGNVVVVVRQDNSPNTFWRIVLPAGSSPIVAANWQAATLMAASTQIGEPDVISLGNNGMWMTTRTALGTSNLNGYNVSWSNGAAPFPQNRANYPITTVRQNWYSQSQLLTPNNIGIAIAMDNPVGVYMYTAPFTGVGQSQ